MARPCSPSCAPACSQTAQSVSSSVVHQLADPGQRRPVGQEAPDRGAQLLLLLTGTQHHVLCSLPRSVIDEDVERLDLVPVHPQRVDFQRAQRAAQRQRGLADPGDGRGDRVQVGGRGAARALQQRQPAQLAEHPPDLGRVDRQQPQAGVLQDLDPDPAQAHGQHRAEGGVDGDAGQQLGPAGAHRRDQHAVDLAPGTASPGRADLLVGGPDLRLGAAGRAPPRRCRTCG